MLSASRFFVDAGILSRPDLAGRGTTCPLTLVSGNVLQGSGDGQARPEMARVISILGKTEFESRSRI